VVEQGSRDGAVVKVLASHSRTRRPMWVEFVVGSMYSVLCFKRFFSGYAGFALSSKTNIFKFQFYLGMHRHL